ncbi:MAG: aroma-sacti cluster domain-containing protein [Blastocatellia bacterium]
MQTNREKLEAAGIILPGTELTPEQCGALDGLTYAEVDSLISVRNKLSDSLGGPFHNSNFNLEHFAGLSDED